MNRIIKGIVGIFFVLVFATGLMAKDEYRIGVLAKRGPEKCLEEWGATADYLKQKLPEMTFEIVPLSFKQTFAAIQNGEVDFFIVNSSMFVTAQQKYNAAAVVTMVNLRQGKAVAKFGGVILTRADNPAINSLNDLKGKTFMGVDQSSFGGWQMAALEMMNNKIDPAKDFAKLEWGASHDKVVYAIRDKKVEAGTVRTDTLETMVAEGTITLSDYKIIDKKEYADFPFVCSTALYPEWPLGKTNQIPADVAAKVKKALMEMKPDDKAAKDAKVQGWTEALDYTPVAELQKTLKVEASDK